MMGVVEEEEEGSCPTGCGVSSCDDSWAWQEGEEKKIKKEEFSQNMKNEILRRLMGGRRVKFD